MKSLLLLVAAAQLAVSTPSNDTAQECRKLKTDADWPNAQAWQAALKGVAQVVPPKGKSAPDYRFKPESILDVQNAVKFANANNIRLTIISTGHDYMARSDAASGLLLDMSEMTSVRVSESFTATEKGMESPKGKTNVIVPKEGVQAAVTFGGGLGTQALNDAISPSKLFTMGAAYGEVAVAGGWGQFGGHGPLTSQYGIGVDQWLEAKIVTADGELKIANKVSNPDLFWAIRGGGGGAFGVIVEATVKAYPDIPITGYNWWVNTTAKASFFGLGGPSQPMKDATAYLVSQLPAVNDKGISGYFYLFSDNLRGYTIHPNKTSGTANANAIWKPILEKISSIPGMTKYQTKPYNFKNFKEFYDGTYGPRKTGGMTAPSAQGRGDPPMRAMYKRHGPGEDMSKGPVNIGKAPMDSRLLSAEHLRNSTGFLKGLVGSGGTCGLLMVAGNKVSKPDDETSAHPAWRKAVAHTLGINIPVMMNMDGFRELAPEMGAYGNEAFYKENNWKDAFWGPNYPRLSAIKTKYDPNMTFWVSPGINADHMEVVNGRLCKVADVAVAEKKINAPLTDSLNSANLLDRVLFGASEVIGAFPAPGTLVGLMES